MRRTLLALAALLGLAVGSAGPAAAITGNFTPDHEHPYVGMLTTFDGEGGFAGRCSGALLSPTVFLTAGHCTEGVATAVVYLQQDAGVHYDPALGHDPVSGYPDGCAAGTLGEVCATSDEAYNWGFADFAGFPDTRDLGLVILDQPLHLAEYAVLADVGRLDDLATARGAKPVSFTVSGYGLSLSSPVRVESYRERLMASSRLTNLTSALTGGYGLQTNGNGKDRGGTCSGDSGGPVLHGGFESDVVVAVTSFGLNALCRGTDFGYRVDTAAAHAWIRETVGEERWAEIVVAGA